MDKKLVDIRQNVEASSEAFFKYLDELFKNDVKKALNEIQEHTNVFLFSGLIRNYFLGIKEYRDIDIVLEKQIDVEFLLKDWEIKRNSFGGFKVLFKSGPMDVWFMKNTWAFQHSNNTLNFQFEQNIPNTAFFNFSSVIYCINFKKFHYTEDFLRFLKYRELDYVEAANANYGLCVVNTFYYSEKFSLKISKRLLKLINSFHHKNRFDYQAIQLKHFGRVLFSDADIEARLAKTLKLSSQSSHRV